MANLKSTTYKGLANLTEGKCRPVKIGHNTYAEMHGGTGNIQITLHRSVIVTIDPADSVRFSLCGYPTATTRERINQFLPAGRSVFQRDGVQYWAQGHGAEPIELDHYGTYSWAS